MQVKILSLFLVFVIFFKSAEPIAIIYNYETSGLSLFNNNMCGMNRIVHLTIYTNNISGDD